MQNISNIESLNFSKSKEEPGRVNDAPTRGTLSCATYFGNRWSNSPTPLGFPFLLSKFIDFLFLVLLIGKLRHKEIKRINFFYIYPVQVTKSAKQHYLIPEYLWLDISMIVTTFQILISCRHPKFKLGIGFLLTPLAHATQPNNIF